MATHVMTELLRVDLGRLQMAQAPTLTTEVKVKAARRYRVFCPIPGCPSTEQDKFFVRKDNVVRHMAECVDPHMTKTAPHKKTWSWGTTLHSLHLNIAIVGKLLYGRSTMLPEADQM